MSKRTKEIIAVVLSVAIILGTLSVADRILREKSEDGITQCAAMYDQPRDTVDVVMLGSSHVHYGINTATLWKNYGIAAYDYSSAEQPLWISYYYLKEFCKYQKPKVVVLDFFSPAAFLDNYKSKYYFTDDQIYGFKFSMNKLFMMNAAFDGKIENWDKYFPSFFGYHDRYDKLEAEDFSSFGKDNSSFKGYVPLFHNAKVSAPVIETDEKLAPSDKSVKYLKKIIDYTNDHDIELYITIVPYSVNIPQQEGLVQQEEARFNWLEDYIESLDDNENIHFDYTIKHVHDFGIDFENGTDVADGNSHLNYYGSIKFSEYLGEDLRNAYGISLLPDHRGEEAYSSWDEHVKIVENKVLEADWEVR